MSNTLNTDGIKLEIRTYQPRKNVPVMFITKKYTMMITSEHKDSRSLSVRTEIRNQFCHYQDKNKQITNNEKATEN